MSFLLRYNKNSPRLQRGKENSFFKLGDTSSLFTRRSLRHLTLHNNANYIQDATDLWCNRVLGDE